MRLVIDDTDNLSELDKDILALVLGEELVEVEEAPAQSAAEIMKTEAAAVSKKAAEAKAKPKPKPEPKPEPEPEPMAEEPLPEEDEDDEEPAEDDGTSDEDLLALAVKKATEMVGSGEAAKVREALDAAGASRVRELNKDNVREFFKALS